MDAARWGILLPFQLGLGVVKGDVLIFRDFRKQIVVIARGFDSEDRNNVPRGFTGAVCILCSGPVCAGRSPLPLKG